MSSCCVNPDNAGCKLLRDALGFGRPVYYLLDRAMKNDGDVEVKLGRVQQQILHCLTRCASQLMMQCGGLTNPIGRNGSQLTINY